MEGERGKRSHTTVWHVMAAAVIAAFAAYVVVRASKVPLTYDEAAAYLRYIATDPLSVFDFSVATNHLLNTVLVKLFSVALGASEPVLRLPGLIGYGFYLAFSLLILRRVAHREIAVGGFLLLNLNPYVLDYFALSRGYGLSLGLMLGAIFFLLERSLARSLAFACAGVLANFSLLNVYLALVVAGLAADVIRSRASARAATSPADGRHVSRTPRSYYLWGPAMVVACTLLIFSQDFGLSEELYEPVAVRIVAANDATLETVRVFRIDRRGRTEPLRRQGDVWVLDRREHFCGLRIELPATAAEGLASIEVVAGNRVFRGRPANGLWRSSDADGMRTLESTASLSLRESKVPAFHDVINWSGDRRYAIHLGIRTALVLSLLTFLALVLSAVGLAAGRAGLLSAGAWGPVSRSAVWIAALAGGPLYLLRRNGELYYGGERGLLDDSFRSVIDGSFYGKTYHPDQTRFVFMTVLAIVAVFAIAAAVGYRRRAWQRILPGTVLLAIMTTVSIAVLLQRVLFDTPYLLGRTALFFIPLYLLFAVFTADAVAGLGRVWRLAAGMVLAVAVSLSVYHFRRTANVTYVLDWPRDAATKRMIADLVGIAKADSRGQATSLGVEWPFYPVAEFYARRAGIPIDVQVLPRRGGTHFMYLEDTHANGSVEVLRRYSVARSVLARPAADAGRPADHSR